MRRALAAVLLAGMALLVPAGPARAAPAETGRYYVVGPPVDGQREYLYAIALRTLGNGNRFREIVQLNEGRTQPDGETFTDGLVLRPGWLLVLPRDAKGQGVRIGRLPTTGARTPRPPGPSTPTPSPTRSSPAPRTAAPTSAAPTSPDAIPAERATRAVAPPPGNTDRTGPVDPLLIRGGAGALAVLFAIGAVVLLRRGGGRRLALEDDGPWPPQRHHTPTPAEPTAGPEAGDATAPPPPSPAPPPPSPAPPPPSPAPPTPAPGRPRPAPASPTPAPPPPALAGVPGTAPTAPPAAGRTDAPVGPQPAREVPRPAVPAGDEVPYLSTELDTELGPIQVRLVGVAAGRGAPAYAWLGPDEPVPPATLPLVLGRKGPWRLHVDLGRAPDVLTLVGDPEDCRRTAVRYARGLRAAGIGVAEVGGALGADAPDGCRPLPELPAPPAPGEDPVEPYVVFTAGLPAASMVGARRLATTTGGRRVPVVLGPVPGGRWSVQVGPVDAPESAVRTGRPV
ncbi:hypothetical protein [Micromonospora sp. NPDC092111]|uniref:hypothetical protein n=1 Tax=Micromonospora sp. NPDC092111 TaxID=3364289 RepID=UPI00382D716F